MTKREFLAILREALYGLSQAEIEERLLFYSEMIDDRMEEGISEEDAVREIGDAREIAAQIRAETAQPQNAEEKETKDTKDAQKRRRRLSVGEILLLILGFPVWFPLLLAAAVVLLAVFIVLFAVVTVLFAVALSLVAVLLSGIAVGTVSIILWNVPLGIALIGAGIFCGGLSIFWFFGSLVAAKGILSLLKMTLHGIGSLFFRKGEQV